MALTDNLLAYWSLNEASGNALDSVGSLTLTDTNTVARVAGLLGNCGRFVRSASEHFTANSGTLFNLGSGNFSIQAWVKPVANNVNYNLVTKDDVSNRQFGLELTGNGNGSVRFFIINSGGSNFGFDTPVNTFSIGAWVHIVVIRRGTTWECWVDGSSKTCNTLGSSLLAGTAMNASTAAFQIGRKPYTGFQNPYDGDMDEVGIWSRAISSAEVSQLNNGGAGLAYPFTTQPPTAVFAKHLGI